MLRVVTRVPDPEALPGGGGGALVVDLAGGDESVADGGVEVGGLFAGVGDDGHRPISDQFGEGDLRDQIGDIGPVASVSASSDGSDVAAAAHILSPEFATRAVPNQTAITIRTGFVRVLGS